MSTEETVALEQYIQLQLAKIDEPDMNYMLQSGLLFPNRTPAHWDTLPDEWDTLMEQQGIASLNNVDLEKYLEQWNRLLGHAYWVRGIYQSRQEILSRTADFVKDYIFTRASGGREQKAAVSGSHPLYEDVLNRLMEISARLHEISGLVYRWEKIEFTITRTITSRSNRGY